MDYEPLKLSLEATSLLYGLYPSVLLWECVKKIKTQGTTDVTLWLFNIAVGNGP